MWHNLETKRKCYVRNFKWYRILCVILNLVVIPLWYTHRPNTRETRKSLIFMCACVCVCVRALCMGNVKLYSIIKFTDKQRIFPADMMLNLINGRASTRYRERERERRGGRHRKTLFRRIFAKESDHASTRPFRGLQNQWWKIDWIEWTEQDKHKNEKKASLRLRLCLRQTY